MSDTPRDQILESIDAYTNAPSSTMSAAPVYDATMRGEAITPRTIAVTHDGPVNQPTTLDTLKEPPRYAKALMGAVLAGTGAAAVASADGFTTGELWGIAATIVAAFCGVYGVRNRV